MSAYGTYRVSGGVGPMSAYHPASSIIPVSLDGPRAAWPRRGMAAACLLLISPYPWGGPSWSGNQRVEVVMQTKADIATGLGGAAAATWLTWGGLDALLAVAVGGLTICLLLIRIGLAVREWWQN